MREVLELIKPTNLVIDIELKTSVIYYEKLEEIGMGQFSTVYKVRYKKTGDIFAMKKIKKRTKNQTKEQKKTI